MKTRSHDGKNGGPSWENGTKRPNPTGILSKTCVSFQIDELLFSVARSLSGGGL